MEAAAREDEGDGAVQALLHSDLGLGVDLDSAPRAAHRPPLPGPPAADEIPGINPSQINHRFGFLLILGIGVGGIWKTPYKPTPTCNFLKNYLPPLYP